MFKAGRPPSSRRGADGRTPLSRPTHRRLGLGSSSFQLEEIIVLFTAYSDSGERRHTHTHAHLIDHYSYAKLRHIKSGLCCKQLTVETPPEGTTCLLLDVSESLIRLLTDESACVLCVWPFTVHFLFFCFFLLFHFILQPLCSFVPVSEYFFLCLLSSSSS